MFKFIIFYLNDKEKHSLVNHPKKRKFMSMTNLCFKYFLNLSKESGMI